MFLTFLLGSMVSGLLGSWILKTITRPLDVVVEQAEAIGGRRFVTSSEPNTLEFKQLVRAMNTLSGRVKSMLDEETQRLEVMRKKSQQDPLTELLNRDAFMGYVKTYLQREDENSSGYLLLARLTPLAHINQELGHRDTDLLIKGIANRLTALCATHSHWQVARLNGSDFAILAPTCEEPKTLAQAVVSCLVTADYPSIADEASLPTAICRYQSGDSIGKLMSRVDGALAIAESDPRQNPVLREGDNDATAELTTSDWRNALIPALDDMQNVQLGQYAVIGKDNTLLHTECPVRLTVFGKSQPAGVVMPWIARLNLQSKLDLAVFTAAINMLKQDPKPLCINLSAEAVNDIHFREVLLSTVQNTSPELIGLLWLEIPENGAYQYLEEFRSLALAIKPYNCKIGLEHVGLQLSRISELHDLGLDYIKVDASFIRDIHQQPHQQSFIQGLCTVAHAIGLLAIAEGVSSTEEQNMLISLGMDGMTGPGIKG